MTLHKNSTTPPTEANVEIGEDDVFDDSDDDDKTSSHTKNHTKRFPLFGDEEDDDVPDMQNTLHKGSGHKKNAGIDSHDTAATDKEKKTQEKQIIKTSITLNNGSIMKKKRAVQPLETINQIKSLQKQTDQMQQVTTKEPQITS